MGPFIPPAGTSATGDDPTSYQSSKERPSDGKRNNEVQARTGDHGTTPTQMPTSPYATESHAPLSAYARAASRTAVHSVPVAAKLDRMPIRRKAENTGPAKNSQHSPLRRSRRMMPGLSLPCSSLQFTLRTSKSVQTCQIRMHQTERTQQSRHSKYNHVKAQQSQNQRKAQASPT